MQSSMSMSKAGAHLDTESQNPFDLNDFPPLDELDPSLADGFSAVYDREVPIELRIRENLAVEGGSDEEGSLESIKAKVCVKADPETGATSVLKIELSSEADLFFHYTALIDESVFGSIREEQKLTVDFEAYISLVLKMFTNCYKEPQSYFAVFFMNKDGKALLNFIQNLEYKFMELLEVDFMASSEENIRENITFRYNANKAKLGFLQNKLKDISALVKVKNPSLMMQIKKSGKLGPVSGSTMRPGDSKILS